MIMKINTMQAEITTELKELSNEVTLKSFEDYWQFLYHNLLTKYGITSSEADEELDIFYNNLKNN